MIAASERSSISKAVWYLRIAAFIALPLVALGADVGAWAIGLVCAVILLSASGAWVLSMRVAERRSELIVLAATLTVLGAMAVVVLVRHVLA